MRAASELEEAKHTAFQSHIRFIGPTYCALPNIMASKRFCQETPVSIFKTLLSKRS